MEPVKISVINSFNGEFIGWMVIKQYILEYMSFPICVIGKLIFYIPLLLLCFVIPKIQIVPNISL